MSKATVLMNVFCPHTNRYKRRPDILEFMLENAEHEYFDLRAEEAIVDASRGFLTQLPRGTKGADVIDKNGVLSEVKVCCVAPNPVGGKGTTYTVTISGVVSIGGSMKIGALRVIIYNPHTDRADFMYIPHNKIRTLLGKGKSANNRAIRFTWSGSKKSYLDRDVYLCETFSELAMKS